MILLKEVNEFEKFEDYLKVFLGTEKTDELLHDDSRLYAFICISEDILLFLKFIRENYPIPEEPNLLREKRTYLSLWSRKTFEHILKLYCFQKNGSEINDFAEYRDAFRHDEMVHSKEMVNYIPDKTVLANIEAIIRDDLPVWRKTLVDAGDAWYLKSKKYRHNPDTQYMLKPIEGIYNSEGLNQIKIFGHYFNLIYGKHSSPLHSDLFVQPDLDSIEGLNREISLYSYQLIGSVIYLMYLISSEKIDSFLSKFQSSISKR